MCYYASIRYDVNAIFQGFRRWNSLSTEYRNTLLPQYPLCHIQTSTKALRGSRSVLVIRRYANIAFRGIILPKIHYRSPGANTSSWKISSGSLYEVNFTYRMRKDALTHSSIHYCAVCKKSLCQKVSTPFVIFVYGSGCSKLSSEWCHVLNIFVFMSPVHLESPNRAAIQLFKSIG